MDFDFYSVNNWSSFTHHYYVYYKYDHGEKSSFGFGVLTGFD